MRVRLFSIVLSLMVLASLGITVNPAAAESSEPPPDLQVEVLADGLSRPWDLAVMPNDEGILFTERSGKLSVLSPDGTVQEVSADLSDVWEYQEAGLMGLALDSEFSFPDDPSDPNDHAYFYTCQATDVDGFEVQVVKWELQGNYSAVRVADPLVGGIPLRGNGSHAGCRLLIEGGHLWISTGDSTTPTAPQDIDSLGGKVLRVDPATGEGVPGNEFYTSGSDNASKVYSYGHRNVQGLAIHPDTGEVWATEHGPAIDDEINVLQSGGNYGWDPGPGPSYDESGPMTFVGGVEAEWSTGDPVWSLDQAEWQTGDPGANTWAFAGGTFIEGDQWGSLEGTLVVPTLKFVSVNFFDFDADGTSPSYHRPSILSGAVAYGGYGRLRTPVLAPDGALLLTTSNGGGADQILRVTPDGDGSGDTTNEMCGLGTVTHDPGGNDPLLDPPSMTLNFDSPQGVERLSTASSADVSSIVWSVDETNSITLYRGEHFGIDPNNPSHLVFDPPLTNVYSLEFFVDPGVSAVSLSPINACPTVGSGCVAGSISGLPQPAVTTDGLPITLSGSPSGGTFSGEGVTFSIFNPSLLLPGQYFITYTYGDQDQCEVTESILVASLFFNFVTYNLGTIEPKPDKSAVQPDVQPSDFSNPDGGG